MTGTSEFNPEELHGNEFVREMYDRDFWASNRRQPSAPHAFNPDAFRPVSAQGFHAIDGETKKKRADRAKYRQWGADSKRQQAKQLLFELVAARDLNITQNRDLLSPASAQDWIERQGLDDILEVAVEQNGKHQDVIIYEKGTSNKMYVNGYTIRSHELTKDHRAMLEYMPQQGLRQATGMNTANFRRLVKPPRQQSYWNQFQRLVRDALTMFGFTSKNPFGVENENVPSLNTVIASLKTHVAKFQGAFGTRELSGQVFNRSIQMTAANMWRRFVKDPAAGRLLSKFSSHNPNTPYNTLEDPRNIFRDPYGRADAANNKALSEEIKRSLESEGAIAQLTNDVAMNVLPHYQQAFMIVVSPTQTADGGMGMFGWKRETPTNTMTREQYLQLKDKYSSQDWKPKTKKKFTREPQMIALGSGEEDPSKFWTREELEAGAHIENEEDS